MRFLRSAYVELVWDPLSLGQTAHLSDLCHKLNEDYSVFSGERSKPAKVKHHTETYNAFVTSAT